MDEYRFDMKVRNNLILSRIEEMGYRNPLDFCKRVKISYISFIKFVNMKESIFDYRGRIRPFIGKLCKVLSCLPEEIFSANQMEANLKDNKRTLKINEAEVKFMLTHMDSQKLLEDHYSDEQLSNKIEDNLETLTLREKKVLQMRFGLGEYDCHTLEEVGNTFNVNRERIRQIEAKALRKLRHLSRSDTLREFIDEKRSNR